VLDLGAGTGKLTATLVALGAEVIAVEPDPAMLTELRRAPFLNPAERSVLFRQIWTVGELPPFAWPELDGQFGALLGPATSETKLTWPAFGGPGCGLPAGTAMGALAGPSTRRA
jgi:hypothetical protein